MKIAIVTLSPLTPARGVERVDLYLRKILSEAGFEVEILSSSCLCGGRKK